MRFGGTKTRVGLLEVFAVDKGVAGEGGLVGKRVDSKQHESVTGR